MEEHDHDLSGLVGRWVNTNAQGRGIVDITIDSSGGELTLQVFSNVGPMRCTWGRSTVGLLCRSATEPGAVAFIGQYDFGTFQVDLQGHLTRGLLTVASFNRVRGYGRHDYFAREFFRRADPRGLEGAVPWVAAFGHVGGDDPVSVHPALPDLPFIGTEIIGDWLNMNPDATGMVGLRVGNDWDKGAILWAWGTPTGPRPLWGPMPAALFAASSGSRVAMAFSTCHRFADSAVTLQASVRQGVLVVTSFGRHLDDGHRPNEFRREFYYRRGVVV
jgi:hypothetical protein